MAESVKSKSGEDHIFIPAPLSGHYDDQVEAAWALSLPELPGKMIPLLSLHYVTRALVDQFHARVLKPFELSFIEYTIFNTLILNTEGIIHFTLKGL